MSAARCFSINVFILKINEIYRLTKYHECIFYRFKKGNCIFWGIWQGKSKP